MSHNKMGIYKDKFYKERYTMYILMQKSNITAVRSSFVFTVAYVDIVLAVHLKTKEKCRQAN
jgi:hypothetical protein